jgi:hypothetical protein
MAKMMNCDWLRDGVVLDNCSYNNIYCSEDEVKDIIKDYNDNKIFNDEMLSLLLKDKIEEEYEKEKAKEAEELLKRQRYTINNFIDCIERVIFSGNKTIMLWKDGTKTIVTCQEGDEFDKEKGLALCIIKYIFGNIGYYNEIFKRLGQNENPKKEVYKPVKKAPSKTSLFDIIKDLFS